MGGNKTIDSTEKNASTLKNDYVTHDVLSNKASSNKDHGETEDQNVCGERERE